MPAPAAATPRMYQFSLTQQIMLGLVVGVLLGGWMSEMAPEGRANWDTWMALIRDIFLHLIKMMIAPLIFASVVQGFAGTGDMKKARRIGVKALIYFEIVTTLALVVGLFVVNVLKPGIGVNLVSDATQSTAGLAKPLTLVEIILHAFPTSMMDAMARNDVLQEVVFAVLFAMAVIAAGADGRPVLEISSSLPSGNFTFASIIMKISPICNVTAIHV